MTCSKKNDEMKAMLE